MIFWFLVLLSLMAAMLAPISALSAFLLLPVAMATLVHVRFQERRTLRWLVLGWLFWLPISFALSQTPGLSLPQAAVLMCLPLGWLAGSALKSKNWLDFLLTRVLPILLLVLLVWGLIQGPNTFTLKPQGPFNDPNTYAALLNLLMLPILAIYLASDLACTSRWLRTGQLALLAAVAFVAFLVSSRGAALALILVLPPLIWMARNQPNFHRKLAFLTTVTLVAYFAALSIGGGVSVAQRLADTVQGGDPTRIMLMKSALLMIQDHPWLGTGLGSFRLLYPSYRYLSEAGTAGGWVHNDYLQLWQEAGLPMLLLMSGLAVWVARQMWLVLRAGHEDTVKASRLEQDEALRRMGYLAAIAAILLHALVNFLFFFALVSLLVGLYLARLAPAFAIGKRSGELNEAVTVSARGKSPPGPSLAKGGDQQTAGTNTRAIRLAAGGYVLILGWLLLGQVAVEGLLGEARSIQRVLLKWDVAYPRYQVAYWVSVLAPFHPTPQQIMGLELASLSGGGGLMRDEALLRMEAARQRAPCYLPYANDALALIQQGSLDAALRQRGQSLVARNLECNARHGLSYYHAGHLATTPEAALAWWRAGMAASPIVADDLLLTAAILSRTTPGQEKALTELAEQMAQSIRHLEENPGVHADQVFWTEVQYKLYRLAGKRYLALVAAQQAE